MKHMPFFAFGNPQRAFSASTLSERPLPKALNLLGSI
jgi:hypothetical protein